MYYIELFGLITGTCGSALGLYHTFRTYLFPTSQDEIDMTSFDRSMKRWIAMQEDIQ